MSRHAQHPETLDQAPPQSLTARERLEWEVAQLADGTLPATRRSAVEAALVRDSQLRMEFEAHRLMNDRLRQPPGLDAIDSDELTRRIMGRLELEPAPGQPEEAPLPRIAPAPASAGIADLLRGWWVTIAATAAALVVGLSLGIVSMLPERGSTVVVELGSQEPGEAAPGGDLLAGSLQVIGPAALMRQRHVEAGIAGPNATVAMTVTGPDFRVTIDPATDTAVPDYAYAYGSAPILDQPSQMVVASTENGR